MRRTLLVLLAADAAAKFALEKKGQKVLNVKLYETGYTFRTSLGSSAQTSRKRACVSESAFLWGSQSNGARTVSRPVSQNFLSGFQRPRVNANRAADASVFDEGFATATSCDGMNSRSFWHTSTGRASNAPAAARSAATFDLRDCMLPILLPRLAMVAVNRGAGVCNDW